MNNIHINGETEIENSNTSLKLAKQDLMIFLKTYQILRQGLME